MNIISSSRIAFEALKVHKVRSLLTVLGLMIGVASIIMVINMGQGIKAFVVDQLEVFGSDYVEVEVKVPSTSKTSTANAIGQAQGITITTLKIDDAKAIEQHPNIYGSYVSQLGQEILDYEGRNKTAILWGASASFFEFHQTKVEEGRPFTEEEDLSLARVAVLGPTIKKDLFGEEDAVGRRVSVGQHKFTVVGVMEEQGTAFFMDMDSLVFIPVRTLQKKILGIDHIQFILAYMRDTSQAQATADDITSIMRERHDISDPKKDDFAVTTADEARDMLAVITGGIGLLLVAIAAISLIVGGVGIMNIMYVSVSERTYEIGLRKAIGATRRDILWQFLWEAVVLTLAGGLVGALIGSAMSIAAAFGARAFGFDWQISFSLVGLVLSVGFSGLVGLIFGLYPARQAAALTPVEAMRSSE